MKSVTYLVIFCLAGCNIHPTDRIIVPTISHSFYQDIFNELHNQIQSDPNNIDCHKQTIFYCEKLDWPTPCIASLNALSIQEKMTSTLLDQYLSYYQRHERFQPLIDIVEDWSEVYDLQTRYHKAYVNALVKERKEPKAQIELRAYVKKNANSIEDLAFAVESYATLQDTTMTLFYLSRLYVADPNNELVGKIYAMYLLKIGNVELAKLMVDQKLADSDYEYAKTLAQAFEDKNEWTTACTLLLPHIREDTVIYRIIDLYKKEEKWDAAISMLDSLIATDQGQRKPLWYKASLLEDRGLLYASLRLYDQLIQRDSLDSASIDRYNLVNRKIAYLQRLKFEKTKVPLIEITPKKIN